MHITEHDVQTSDGRSLHVYDAGDPNGVPVVFHHGTPSAGRPYKPHVALAEEQGVRALSYDRPGYGGSTRHAGRAVVEAAADTEAVADALGIDRFATWGLSGGGPHALACAARLGNRVTAVATMAGAAPSDVPDFDFLAGMGDGNIEEFGLAAQGEDALRPMHEQMAAAFEHATVPQLVEEMQPFLSEVDSAVLDGELGGYLLDTFRRALANGVDGWVDDDLAFVRGWGFDVAEVARPALVVQGRQDLMVPLGHGEWLARTIPGAEARLSETEGHLTLFVSATRDLNAWLLAHS